MALLPDLIELSGLASNRTYSGSPSASHRILGFVDNATYTGDDDNPPGTIIELNDTASDGGILTINGVTYAINVVVPDSTNVTIGFANGAPSVNLTGDGGSTQIAFIEAMPTAGGATRYFAAIDDDLGSFTKINSIQTRALDFSPLGSDVEIDLDANNAVTAVCFAAGTLIETAGGWQAVETLLPGDMVLTADNGAQPLRWVGQKHLGPDDLNRNPRLAPVRIAEGALGRGLPYRPLTVSPQHRMLIGSRIADRIFGAGEVLVPALHLVGLPGIRRYQPKNGVLYCHLLFDRHEIVFANGAPSESLLRGKGALGTLTPEARAEISALFPDAPVETVAQAARPVHRQRSSVAELKRRHLKNGQPLLQALDRETRQ